LQEADALKDKLPFQSQKDPNFVQKNYQALESEIQKCETDLRSGSISIKDEKKHITYIASLSQKKKYIREYEKKYNVWLASEEPLNQLSAEIDAIHEKLNVLFGASKEVQNQGDEFKKKTRDNGCLN